MHSREGANKHPTSEMYLQRCKQPNRVHSQERHIRLETKFAEGERGLGAYEEKEEDTEYQRLRTQKDQKARMQTMTSHPVTVMLLGAKPRVDHLSLFPQLSQQVLSELASVSRHKSCKSCSLGIRTTSSPEIPPLLSTNQKSISSTNTILSFIQQILVEHLL